MQYLGYGQDHPFTRGFSGSAAGDSKIAQIFAPTLQQSALEGVKRTKLGDARTLQTIINHIDGPPFSPHAQATPIFFFF